MEPDEVEQAYLERFESAQRALAEAEAKAEPKELILLLTQNAAIARLNLKVRQLEQRLEKISPE
jgi:ssRNA-specific RNase YbeY (16S rRNA maturation enzyme)